MERSVTTTSLFSGKVIFYVRSKDPSMGTLILFPALGVSQAQGFFLLSLSSHHRSQLRYSQHSHGLEHQAAWSNPDRPKMDHVERWVASGVVLWGALFLAVRKVVFPRRSFDFSNRIVSSAHAVLAVALASLSVKDWSCPVCPVASASSPLQMKVLAVTLSYMIYDLICCLCEKEKFAVDNAIHHLVSIVGIGAGLAYQRCGSEMVGSLWITEISSPFLHARELLKELGHIGTDLNLAMDVLFAATFSGARMICGPVLAYVTLTADNPILIKAMALGLQLVSAFWFYKIIRMLKYKFVKRMKLA